MALTNKQKRAVIETAKANGYKGDYTSLFKQVESEQVFNTTAPGIPVPELTKEDITFTEPDDHKFNLKSLLVDRTPHRFNDNDNFITKDHSVKPNNKSILRFLNDPEYTPTAEPNMGANGGVKKYDEGGTPHDHPHPTTETETETETTSVETADEIQTRRRPRNPYGAAGSYKRYLESEEYGPSQLNNTLKMQEFLGLEQDGTFGDDSKEKMLSWSNKNLSSLPVYDPNFKTMNIKCSGKQCSEQTTNVLQLLYPQLDRNQLDPDHSWYRRDRILKNGGTDLWSQDVQNINKESRDERSDFTGIPPMDVWNTFQVGDIVSMDSRYYQDDANDDSNQVNDGAEHTGFIIGRDPETGIPLVMHGYGGKMEVDPLNQISLGNDRRGENPTYIISGISRPKAMGDGENNNYTFDKLNFFLEKDDFATHNTFSFNEDYYNNMSEGEREMADQFTNFFNGSTRIEREVANYDNNYEANNTHQVLSENDSLVRLAEASGSSIRAGESRFDNSYPIQKIANITGYSKDEVSKAAMMTWGFYQNETGDANSIRKGKGMEWVKDNMSTKNAAKLKALKKGDITWTPFSNFGGIFSFEINEEDYMYSAQQEPSRGILRIKYNMQTTDADNNTTRVGFWAEQYGISRSDLTSEDDNENTLITGTPGKEGVQSSFAMGTLLTLSYYENIRRKPGYDPETETYKGVPIDYVVATMHKGLNLNSQSGDGNTILKNLQKGNRDYSNVTINNANQLSYTKTQLDPKFLEANNPVEAVIDRKIISENNKPFESSIQFMNRARNADGSIPKPLTLRHTGVYPNKT